jgi:hypothetical protein
MYVMVNPIQEKARVSSPSAQIKNQKKDGQGNQTQNSETDDVDESDDRHCNYDTRIRVASRKRKVIENICDNADRTENKNCEMAEKNLERFH